MRPHAAHANPMRPHANPMLTPCQDPVLTPCDPGPHSSGFSAGTPGAGAGAELGRWELVWLVSSLYLVSSPASGELGVSVSWELGAGSWEVGGGGEGEGGNHFLSS
jgi:hypothetical protein